MEFFDKLGKKASEAYKMTADKTGKIAKETKIKFKIGELRTQVNDVYEEIGKKVYEKHVLEGKISIENEIEEYCTKLDVLSDELKFMGSMLLGIPFFDAYHLKKDIDVSKLNLQKEEVSEVSFMSKSEINELIDNDLMIKSHGISFRKFFN